MPVTLRPHRRFPLLCPVTYHTGLSRGTGTLENLSLSGWRLSGDVPLHIGQTCLMTFALPNEQHRFVVAAIVRWKRGQDYGLETLVMEKQTQRRLEHYLKRLVQAEAQADTLRQLRPTV